MLRGSRHSKQAIPGPRITLPCTHRDTNPAHPETHTHTNAHTHAHIAVRKSFSQSVGRKQ